MAKPSSRRDEFSLESSPSDEDRKTSSTSNRRWDYYGSQRVSRESRPTTGASASTSKSRAKRGSYQQPANYSNLDEEAVPPPIENPDDKATYGRQSALEDTVRESRTSSKPPREAKVSDRPQSARKRRNVPHGSQDLTEIAAPPPIQKSLDDEAAPAFGHEQYLEDAKGQKEGADDSSLPFQQKSPEDYLSRRDQDSQVPKYLTELYAISYLIFFAIFGTLARLGVQWITFYPGAPIVTPVIWANFAGSLIMGFLSEDQALFRDRSSTDLSNGVPNNNQRRRSKIGEDLDEMAKAEHSKRKKTIPLYIGFSTGFCGSFTSFSSFARDFFLALSNKLPCPITHPHPGLTIAYPASTISRNGGYSFEAFLHVVITTLALSLGGLIAGAQIAIFLDPITPRIHGSFIRKFVDRLMVPLAFGCWLGAVVLAIWPPQSHETWRGEVLFAIVFAPMGCLLRFYASAHLNGLVPSFPLGTFAVNMLGTAVEGMCFDIQHVGVGIMGRVGGGLIGCQVLQGVLDGFCGCLTTVSTWVAEINGLKRKHGWGYAFSSIIGGLCLMLVIMGSVRWTVDFQNEVCNTGYASKVHG